MIDTAEKRRTAGGVPFLPLGPNVTPNAAQDAEWRAQSAWGYRFIFVPPAGGEGLPAIGLGQKKSFSDALELGGGGW